MEYEKSKQKYLDKLKKTSSKGLNKLAGVSDIQNDNSVCFNETHQKYKPNDLLAKIDCYIRENPTSHITRNRLTVKRGLDQRGFVSNVQNRNNLDIVHKSSHEKDYENVISFIKPKRKVLNYKPKTKIKFGTPDATSTIKHKQTQFDFLQNQQNLRNTKIMDCTDGVSCDKSKNDFNNMPLTSSGSDFIFEPVINLFESPGLCTSKLSQDSFACSSQEILYTNSDDSMNTDENKLKPHKDNFSSTENCINENTENTYNLGIVHKSSHVQDLKNVISFLKPKRKQVNYNVETKIKFDSPDATSTIKHKQTQLNIISSTLTSPKILRRNMQGTTSKLLDPEINKNQSFSTEEKTRLNSTYCLYLKFVRIHCAEITRIDKNIYSTNDYSVNLKKKLKQFQLKHQNQQNLENTQIMDCTDHSCDKSNYDFNNMPSTSGGRDFIFKPDINLFESPNYSVHFNKKLIQFQLKHQNRQNLENTQIMDCTDHSCDKSNYDFNNMSSTSSGSNFIFEPVINLFESPDYSLHFKKKLIQFQLKHQNQQNLENTKTKDCTDRSCDKSKYYFNNMPSASSGSDFIFEPVIESPGLSTSKLPQDSFACSSQEILYTNSDDSMNTDENKQKPHKDNFSSTEICLNENTKNTCQLKLTDSRSRLSFHTSLEKSTQKADLTIGDFYGCWWKVRNGLSKVNTDLSRAIQASMIKRQHILMFNNIFVSAIYMDPRFQILLVPEFKKKAQDHICKLWNLVCTLKNVGRPQEECPIINQSANVHIASGDITNETDDFELFLKSKSGSSCITNSIILQPNNICAIVESYDGIQGIPYESNVREYWSLKEKEMPELYEISQILMSIPATQVSVERTFSSLKFILSRLHF